MIVSIGLGIFLRYFFLYLFTGDTRQYPDYQGAKGIDIGPISLAAGRLLVDGGGDRRAARVILALQRTRIGKATRAVSDNPALAAASGIDVDRVIRVVWVSGATLGRAGRDPARPRPGR